MMDSRWKEGDHLREAKAGLEMFEDDELRDGRVDWKGAIEAVTHALLAIEERLGQLADGR